MILVMVLTAAVGAYADTGAQTRDTDSVSFITNRTGRTTADVSILVNFSEEVDRYNIVVYLQKKENGVWVEDSSNDEYVFYNNGGGIDYGTFNHTYTSLVSGVNYRIKCISKDYIGSTVYTTTSYSNQF